MTLFIRLTIFAFLFAGLIFLSYRAPHEEQSDVPVSRGNGFSENEGRVNGDSDQDKTLETEPQQTTEGEPDKKSAMEQFLSEIEKNNSVESVPEDVVHEHIENPYYISEERCRDLIDKNPFYTNLKSQTVYQQDALLREGHFAEAELLRHITCYPQAAWFTSKDAEKMKALAEHEDNRNRIMFKMSMNKAVMEEMKFSR